MQSSPGRTGPDLLAAGPESSFGAKLFRELDKISYKSGLYFLTRPNTCILFLIFVKASGPVDCLQQTVLASAACSVLPTSTGQRSWDHLKRQVLSVYLLFGFTIFAVRILNFALQKHPEGSKLTHFFNRIKAKPTWGRAFKSRCELCHTDTTRLTVLLSPLFLPREPKIFVMQWWHKAQSLLQTFMKTKYNSRN